MSKRDARFAIQAWGAASAAGVIGTALVGLNLEPGDGSYIVAASARVAIFLLAFSVAALTLALRPPRLAVIPGLVAAAVAPILGFGFGLGHHQASSSGTTPIRAVGGGLVAVAAAAQGIAFVVAAYATWKASRLRDAEASGDSDRAER